MSDAPRNDESADETALAPAERAAGFTPAVDSSADRPHLELESVSMAFGSQPVLRDISLRIKRGETVAVIGESGCGKTVLLKLMIGLLRPTAGRVRFDNMDLAALSDHALTRARTRFGFVFQGAALFDSLSVEQNIAFGLREHDRLPDEADVRRTVERLLREVGLPAEILGKKPAELSGGMRKRVGLARALAMDPEIVLYDEPTTGLDPIMSDVINELVIQTRLRHTVTSVVVTHDMRTAQKVADRIVMLYPLARLERHEPQVLFEGTPAEINQAADPRVAQFVRGEAGERLTELANSRAGK
jgi:phospholipid/cholesterol/gamma-HCH transport system ATP-binding protein